MKNTFLSDNINSIHQKNDFFKFLLQNAPNKQQFFVKSLFWREKYDILYKDKSTPTAWGIYVMGITQENKTQRGRSFFSEEARLEARIARDTRRLDVLRARKNGIAESRVASAALERKLFSHKSYIMFIWDAVTSTRGYEIWDEILTFARRFRLISATLRIGTLIMSALEAGAVFLLAAGILLAFSPALLLLTLAATIDSVISGSRADALVSRITKNKRLAFIFPPRGALGEDRFLSYNAKTLSSSIRCTVFVVSPYLFSSRGIGGHGQYTSVRCESEGVYIIRRQAYFRLRRRHPRLFEDRGTMFIYL